MKNATHSDTSTISLVIAGINGRMGRASVQAIQNEPSIKLVGAYGRHGASYTGKKVQDLVGLPDKNGSNPIVKDSLDNCLGDLSSPPDVFLDFTEAHSAFDHAMTAITKGIRPIIGTTGLSEQHLMELKNAAAKSKLGVLVVPNFAVGMILLINFARQASKFFKNVEILETHRLGKLDAPSGTSMYTGKVIAEKGGSFNETTIKERELLAGARGGKLDSGIRVHSLRLPGILARQDVLMANDGELLTLRHESHNAKSFEQGIVLAIKAVIKLNSFVLGLDSIVAKQLLE